MTGTLHRTAAGTSPQRAAIDAAVSAIRARTNAMPGIALILGTGLGGLARQIERPVVIEYTDIPGFPTSTVESHAGRLLVGTLGGKSIVAMQGRFHRYEGYSVLQVTFPVRARRQLGVDTRIVAKACGRTHPRWAPGELILSADRINLLGDNPLIGPNVDALGRRLPDMSMPYDAELRALARDVETAKRITLREG